MSDNEVLGTHLSYTHFAKAIEDEAMGPEHIQSRFAVFAK